jgi:hypothetical protein
MVVLRVFVIGAAAAWLLALPSRASAQTSGAGDPALVQWIEDFKAWQAWWAEWANRPEPGWLTSSRPRRAKPAPPEWLAERCATVFIADDPLAPACTLLAQWKQDNLTARARATTAVTMQKSEDHDGATWWEHVHVDLLWPATQVRNHIYGVVGVHPALTVRGRLHVFLAPGLMLLNVPEMDGTRSWKMATDYGVGYRLLDFNFPRGQRASLHVNIAKSWLISDTRDLVVSRNVDFAGFSISFKR